MPCQTRAGRPKIMILLRELNGPAPPTKGQTGCRIDYCTKRVHLMQKCRENGQAETICGLPPWGAGGKTAPRIAQ